MFYLKSNFTFFLLYTRKCCTQETADVRPKTKPTPPALLPNFAASVRQEYPVPLTKDATPIIL